MRFAEVAQRGRQAAEIADLLIQAQGALPVASCLLPVAAAATPGQIAQVVGGQRNTPLGTDALVELQRLVIQLEASSRWPCRCSTVPRLSEMVADMSASLPVLAHSSARPSASRATGRFSSRAAAMPTARYAAARSRCVPS